MKVKIDIDKDIVHVSLDGRMHLKESMHLKSIILDYFEQGYRVYCIEMSSLQYIDSSGLGVLVGLQKKAIKLGGRIKVSNVEGTVKELFELTKLDLIF